MSETASDATNSRLLTLPAELRLLIYEALLEDMTVGTSNEIVFEPTGLLSACSQTFTELSPLVLKRLRALKRAAEEQLRTKERSHQEALKGVKGVAAEMRYSFGAAIRDGNLQNKVMSIEVCLGTALEAVLMAVMMEKRRELARKE